MSIVECSLKKFHPYPLDLNGDENNESLFKYVPTIISSLYENSSKINNEIIRKFYLTELDIISKQQFNLIIKKS